MTHLINSAFDRHAMQRISAWLAWACLLLDRVFAAAGGGYWAVADTGLLAARANMLPLNIQAPVQDWQRV